MNSTNNEIYKIAKYLDKYTKESNKEGGVYLQKLDNYLHKVQRGGNGKVLELAKQIGEMVKVVIEKHQQAKSELQKSLGGVEGDSLEKQYNEKVRALQEQISRLEETIAQKQSSPSPKAAAASSAPEVITFDTVTRDILNNLTSDELYNLVCQKAEIDPNTAGLKTAFTNKIKNTTNFASVWTFNFLLDDLYTEPYFKKDDHVVDLMKIIRVLLQLRARFSLGSAPSEIEEIYKYLQSTHNKEMFNRYINDNLYLKKDYTFTYSDFQKYLRQQIYPAAAGPASALAASTAPVSPALRETVFPNSELSKQLAEEAKQQLRAVPQKNPSTPFSKKFDIVGFTITKYSNISSYVIPDDQKEKVLEVLPPELKEKLLNKNVQLITINRIMRARIEFKDDLPIKNILGEINERENPQPIVFETTVSRSAGKPLKVWLFIVPMTFKIDVDTIDADIPYLEAINKLTENEFKKISSIMEGINQPVSKSPGGSAAPTLASEAMTDDSLTSKKFEVVGYIDTIEYVFPTKEKTEGKETVNVLIEEQQQSILDALHLQLTDIKKENSFKVTEAGVRIVLQNPVNIREFVNSINKKPTNVSLTHSGQYDTVRLFIKPMTFGEKNNPINILASKINKEIRAEIVQQPPSEQQWSAASSSSRGRRGIAQSTSDRGAQGGSMSSRGPYRHPSSLQTSTPSTPPTPITNE